jgi:hypothetical protein
VHPAGCAGNEALGVDAERTEGPTPARALKIPLSGYSVFRDVIESGQVFFGEGDDDVLREHLYAEIGTPSRPTMLLLPLKGLGQVRAVIYGDFGKKTYHPYLWKCSISWRNRQARRWEI